MKLNRMLLFELLGVVVSISISILLSRATVLLKYLNVWCYILFPLIGNIKKWFEKLIIDYLNFKYEITTHAAIRIIGSGRIYFYLYLTLTTVLLKYLNVWCYILFPLIGNIKKWFEKLII